MTEKIEPHKKYLRFDHDHAKSVINGHKTKTFRFDDEKDLRAGDIIDLIDKKYDMPFAEAEVISAEEERIKDLTEEDLHGQDNFQTVKDLINALARSYSRSLGDEDI